MEGQLSDQTRYREIMADAHRGAMGPEDFREIERLRARLGELECARIDYDMANAEFRRTA